MDHLVTHIWLDMPLLLAQVEDLDDGNSVWEGWGSVIFTIGLFTLIVVLAVAVLWFVRGMKIASAEASRDTAYRELAEKSATYQANLLEQQQRMSGDLGEVKARVERIEQILKEVE